VSKSITPYSAPSSGRLGVGRVSPLHFSSTLRFFASLVVSCSAEGPRPSSSVPQRRNRFCARKFLGRGPSVSDERVHLSIAQKTVDERPQSVLMAYSEQRAVGPFASESRWVGLARGDESVVGGLAHRVGHLASRAASRASCLQGWDPERRPMSPRGGILVGRRTIRA